MIWVGLTGGIGSGKSTVARFLREAGAFIIDADEIAHAVMRKGGPAYWPVVEEFGPGILDDAGEIDRKKLGGIVFGNPARRERLERLVHPHVFAQADAERKKITADHPDAIIVFDVPLLIETGADREMAYVILADADRETQIDRITRRDKLSREEAERRIDAQMPLDEKRRFADVVIDTRPPLRAVEDSVKALYQKLLKAAKTKPIS